MPSPMEPSPITDTFAVIKALLKPWETDSP